MTTLFRLMIVGFSLSVCINVLANDVRSKVTYKWTDEQGITQYTERPPKDRAYEKITVNVSGGKEISKVSVDEAAKKSELKANESLDEIAQADKRNCIVSQKNMEILTKLDRIRISDKKGETRILTPAEKQARVDETQKQIEVYCK